MWILWKKPFPVIIVRNPWPVSLDDWLLQLIPEGNNVVFKEKDVCSCTNLCFLDEPGAFSEAFSIRKINVPVSSILEEAHLVILCRQKFKSQVIRHGCKSLSQGTDPAG